MQGILLIDMPSVQLALFRTQHLMLIDLIYHSYLKMPLEDLTLPLAERRWTRRFHPFRIWTHGLWWPYLKVESALKPNGYMISTQIMKIILRGKKAILVAKGFTQRHEVDCHDAFSPVAKYTTFRIFTAFITIRGWVVTSLDIENAFFNSKLSEEIYGAQASGIWETGS